MWTPGGASGFILCPHPPVVSPEGLPHLSRGEAEAGGQERNRSCRSQRGKKARQTAALVSMGRSVKRLIVI